MNTGLSFNGVTLTQETILATRKAFDDNEHACIAEAESGKVKVTNLASYRDWCEENARMWMSGLSDQCFTFLQRAYWLQTGQSVPFLPDYPR